MSVVPPERVWWTEKIPKEEKTWITIAIIWGIVMFIMMPLWHVVGKQNPSTESYTTTPAEFMKEADAFIAKYKVGAEKGVAVVEPPAGSDIYMVAQQWNWYPVLKLKKGATYRLHLSSLDMLHGFSLYPMSTNFMVVPNYDYVITITPTETGDYHVVCNEFCGLGHQMMVGKIIVE